MAVASAPAGAPRPCHRSRSRPRRTAATISLSSPDAKAASSSTPPLTRAAPRAVLDLFYTFAALAIGFCLLTCFVCTALNVRGPGLALRGPDGSMNVAVGREACAPYLEETFTLAMQARKEAGTEARTNASTRTQVKEVAVGWE